MAIESLSKSIQEIENYDFSGTWSTDIYLDPENETVYTFTDTNCVPATAYNRIDHRLLSVKPQSVASSVVRWLIDNEEMLEEIISEYQGSKWDGNNHRGVWSDRGVELLDELSHAPVEIASYWDAGDWFSPVEGDLRTEWESGKTAEQIVDEQGCGDDVDGMCDRNEAIAWLESKIEEWEADQDD